MVKLLKSETSKPVVSIIFPVYNSAKFLSESLKSLLDQTYENFELIIINDGSIDQSKKIILSYKDSRIKYHEHNSNLGLVHTLNEGFKIAQGRYIARMDPDDICATNRIGKQVRFLELHPDIDILGSWIQNFGLYDYVWRVHTTHDYISTKLLFENSIAHPSVMIRAKSLHQNPPIKFEERYHGAEDYMFWSKQVVNGLRFANLAEPLLKYRTHPTQVGEAEKSRQQKSSLLVRTFNISRLGINPTAKEKEIHQKLSSWIPLYGLKEVMTTSRWLVKLLHANRIRKVYAASALTTVIGEKWAIICYLTGKNLFSRVMYLLSAPQLLPIALKTLYLRYRGKLYENA